MKDTQIREDQGDMTTKCSIVSEIGSWNMKKDKVWSWVNNGVPY